MSCKESFSSNTEAITHDSDVRKLSFVFRDPVSGDELPIDPIQVAAQLPANPELLPLYFASVDGLMPGPVFTSPFEIRNRNKASFNFQFVKPADTIVPTAQPTVAPFVGPSPVEVEWGETDTDLWGFIAANTFNSNTLPIFTLPAAPVAPTTRYLTKVKITVTEAFAAAGLVSCVATVTEAGEDPTLGGLLHADMMTPGTYQTPTGFAIQCNGQPLTWNIECSGVLLNAITDGIFTVEMTYEDRSVGNLTFNTSSEYMGTGTSKTVSRSVQGAPNGARLTRVIATVNSPFVGEESSTFSISASMLPSGTPVLGPFSPMVPGTVFDSGPLNIVVDTSIPGGPFRITCTSDDLSRLEAGGLITFQFYWSIDVVVPFTWTDGDTIAILAFASLDDDQYVPIAMARHDWSNTPFVDIVKFDLFNIPDDFDPGTSLSALYPTIDPIAFKNSLMLYMSEFDNLSTWNYIRFLIAWHPMESSGNGDVALQITANAREL